jgi:hypothetical protein
MIQSNEGALRDLINASGFLFQLAVEHDVHTNTQRHGWKVVAREHPWSDQKEGLEGYIDLILKKAKISLVIECKRPRGGTWVFLKPDKVEEFQRARCQWIDYSPSSKGSSGCSEFPLSLKSLESEFCVVRGQGEEGKTMLERMSERLLRSLDCLALEELEIAQVNRTAKTAAYLPVIITTADLKICRFDPNSICLSDGTLTSGNFETVPLVRFRKSLTTWLSPGTIPQSLRQAGHDKERTVVVVNASDLSPVLEKLDFDWEDLKDDGLPWDSARARQTES